MKNSPKIGRFTIGSAICIALSAISSPVNAEVFLGKFYGGTFAGCPGGTVSIGNGYCSNNKPGTRVFVGKYYNGTFAGCPGGTDSIGMGYCRTVPPGGKVAPSPKPSAFVNNFKVIGD